MKVALVHDWLNGMRGGEKVLAELCSLYPEAPIYTLFRDEEWQPAFLQGRTIHTSFLQRWPFIQSRYRYYLPWFPRAIESFGPLREEVVISTSHCVAKGVRVGGASRHLSYIFAPMRYMWDQFEEYFGKQRASPVVRAAALAIRPRLRRWDVATHERVTRFVAISRHTAQRVLEYYRREADLVYPPVDVERLAVSKTDEGFYLIVSALVSYKQIDVAIAGLRLAARPLVIIGEGPDRRRLEGLAGPGATFLGWQADDVVREYYAKCRALVFSAEEDFGLVPVEAMASGKPVIALGKGGATETVIPLGGPGGASPAFPTGVWYLESRPEAVAEAVRRFEAHRAMFQPEAIRAHAMKFCPDVFRAGIQEAVNRLRNHVPRSPHASA